MSRMDLELLRALVETATDVLIAAGEPSSSVHELSRLVDRIPGPGVGPQGELLEWDRHRREHEPHHRHLSHLVGLFLLDIWNVESHPAWGEAAARSLLRRGAESTG